MKLVAAKCPSCSAPLDVDANAKSTVCDYCKETIIVDEAIEKLRIELTGNVKVKGIKDADDKIEMVKKYLKLDKRLEAYEMVQEIIKEDPFNLEALSLYIEAQSNALKDFNVNMVNGIKEEDEEKIINNAEKLYGIIDLEVVLDYLNTIKKLDETNEYTEFVEIREKNFKKFQELYNRKMEINTNIREKQKALAIKCSSFITDGGNYDAMEKRFEELMSKFGFGLTKHNTPGVVLQHITDNTVTIKGEVFSSRYSQTLEEREKILEELISKYKTEIAIKYILISTAIVLLIVYWVFFK